MHVEAPSDAIIKHDCEFMCHIKSTDESLHNERRRREFCNDSSVLLM